jgi:hypothetical protein
MIDVFNISNINFPPTNSINIPGVRYIDRKIIPLKAILNDSIRNSVRKGGSSEYVQHIDDLANDFTRGVDITASLPVVEVLVNEYSDKDGAVVEYGMVDGHHRVKALLKLGVNEYIFDIYSFDDETARILFQLEMNNHRPAKCNTDSDIVTIYANLIKQKKQFIDILGEVDTDALEDSLKRTTKYTNNKIMNRIIPGILRSSGALTKNKNYVDDEGEKWVYSNMPGRVLGSKGGDLWIFKTGTWERTYQRMKRAIFNERNRNVDRIHEIILNVQADVHEDVSASRIKFIEDIQKAFNVDAFMTDGKSDLNIQNKYFKISYAFPQIRDGSEDMNKPVKL